VFFNFSSLVGRYATITFHSVSFTPISGGRFRENANLQVVLQVPHPAIFHILDLTINMVLQPFMDTYWLAWSNDYYIVLDGVVWEYSSIRNSCQDPQS
jgi:hypothetical protein